MQVARLFYKYDKNGLTLVVKCVEFGSRATTTQQDYRRAERLLRLS